MQVLVRTGSRLHFGLLGLGHGTRRFGGIGLMVDHPALELIVRDATTFRAVGPHAARVMHFTEQWFRRAVAPSREWGERYPQCEIEVRQAPPEHHGLGLGTQLGLAVAAGLCAFHGWPEPHASRLADLCGRRGRSSVGTHGFGHGGLILEPGRREGQAVAPLERHLYPPADWRCVLLLERASRDATERGLGPASLSGERSSPSGEPSSPSGEMEQQMIQGLPPIAPSHRAHMLDTARQELFPAAAAGDFATFAAALFRYGQLAGQLFATCQGGTFSHPRLADRAAALRAWGIAGVAQSSWGPTLVACTESSEQADWLKCRIDQAFGAEVEAIVTPIRRRGAQLELGG